ncbi:MAG: PKD domain-containing protein [Candidatus Thermoplasmatota archaeon]
MKATNFILPILIFFYLANAQSPPYFVIGYVYVNEKPLAEVNVTIINIERNEKVFTTTDQYGFYLFEVGYSQNWRNGEEIIVSVEIEGENYTMKDFIKEGTHQWINFTIGKDYLKADFYWNPEEPYTVDEIKFYDISQGSIVNYTWDFGDGEISYEKNPLHRYRDDGIYEVRLRIVDRNGNFDELKKKIYVKNVMPTANFSYEPENPKINEEVRFIDSSYDLDGYIINYTWNFGDGNISYEKNPTHIFSSKGEFTVNLRVEDNDGSLSEKTLNIKVNEQEEKSKKTSMSLLILFLSFIISIFLKHVKC